eukprot:COSAG02_NODE_32013_length_523_cov_1.106132_1_plen_25_part_01
MLPVHHSRPAQVEYDIAAAEVILLV